MSQLYEVVDTQVRRQGRNRFLVNAAMLTMLLGSLTLIGLHVPTDKATSTPSQDPRVVQLQEKTARQDRELDQLRELFTYCRTTIHWSDDKCGSGSPMGSLTPVTVIRANDTSDNSDSDGSSDRVTVTVVPPKDNPTPQPTSNPPPQPKDPVDSVVEHVDKLQDAVKDITDMSGVAAKR